MINSAVNLDDYMQYNRLANAYRWSCPWCAESASGWVAATGRATREDVQRDQERHVLAHIARAVLGPVTEGERQ